MTPSPWRKRWLRRGLMAFAALAGLWLLASAAVGWMLTRRARPVAEEPLPKALAGLAEAVRLTTRDGERLGAWFLPGRADTPVVLVLHGNGRSRSDCLPQAALLRELGCPALLVTLRAHGDSSGELNDCGYSARHDVVACIDWLEERTPGRRVVVWGQSLGSAAALFAAEEVGERVGGYLLECPYRDLRTAVRNRTRFYLPPVLDQVAYAGLLAVSSLILPSLDDISPQRAASSVPRHVPVLILAGGADRKAPPEEARAIAAQIASAEVIVFEDPDHLQLPDADPERYRRVVSRFLLRAHRPGPAIDR